MASYRKRGKTWEARVTWRVDGKLKQVTKGGFRLKAEAENYAENVKANLKIGIDPLSNKEIIFSEYIKEWYETFKKNQSSSATQKRYLNVVKLN